MTTQDLHELEALTGLEYKARLCELAPELIRVAKQSQRLREALLSLKPDMFSGWHSAELRVKEALAATEPSSDPCQLGSIPREDVLPLVKIVTRLSEWDVQYPKIHGTFARSELEINSICQTAGQALETFTAKYGEVEG